MLVNVGTQQKMYDKRMNKVNWNYPTTMWVGEKRINDLDLACNILNIQKPLLVTDKHLSKKELFLDILDNLKEKNIEKSVFSNVIGNPTGSNIIEGVEKFHKNKNDGIIAFGGGSALDVGKAIAFMSAQDLPIWEFEDVGDNWKKANVEKKSVC